MRIVIKIGTSTLTHGTGHLNIRRVEGLCKVISDIKNSGHEVILVSSGAIGMGVGKLGLRSRPTDIPTKQAAAAVGQCELMYTYDKLFGEYHHAVAQLLITGDDVENEKRHSNFSNTLNRLLELGALPILNENDTVSTDEIVIGDNDTLAAIVAQSVKADHRHRRPDSGSGRRQRHKSRHRRHGHQAAGGEDLPFLRLLHGHYQRQPPGESLRYSGRQPDRNHVQIVI